MDLTPLIPTGRQIVESYGDLRFRVSGTVYEGSVLIFPQQTLAWPVASLAEMTTETLTPVISRASAGEVDLLLVGCGPRLLPIAKDLRAALRSQGIVMEPMDTGAAARTYNVLMAEGRRIEAALIAV